MLSPSGNPEMQPPEDSLLSRLRQGDPEAWTAFVARYKRMVHAVGYRMTGNAADAEEILQESFLAFSKALPGFRGEAKASTFLYRIAVNAGLRHAARKEKDRAAPLGEDLPAKAVQDPGDQDALLAEVRFAVLALPLQQRAVFTLRHYEDQSIERIAEILDLAPGTVKAHLHQAVQGLRRQLKHRLATRQEDGRP
jgi:RNA polymerase sigma-70 factor (ECF subfamily)